MTRIQEDMDALAALTFVGAATVFSMTAIVGFVAPLLSFGVMLTVATVTLLGVGRAITRMTLIAEMTHND